MGWLRLLLLVLIARPLARIIAGADVYGREHLPLKGPAIVVANHNSHVDTLLMLSIFPARALPRVRPAAAADYFLANPVVGWFSRHVIGIVPVERKKGGAGTDVLAPAREALAQGDIVLIYPEGTRGDASDRLQPLKTGVARLAAAFPEAPVIPAWIAGAGRVLPKGETVPVPLNCSVHVGPPLRWSGDKDAFMEEVRAALERLHAQAPPLRWSEAEDT
ncbi:lysophospholipid acyltransferase family protein [Phenylobacterium sp.]|jgi:1-acyl-sn-glycerol-3-phosphate acyltransferase|uniref:lysophospholipid acyltransferase family protein n=1 Tax=Phenylobacterium sp. TaxID=1871053 RepID=UPI002E32E552|nr:lysophospholipid acyltransferase family protein [Phenylobacterium sp.]HEX2561603.1 lysophospholipid acyltransferase family protein [Phenylobacterium sp.]